MPARKPHDALVIFPLWLLVFSASSQIMIVSPMLKQIGEELGVAEALRGTLVSAYAIMVGVFAIAIGPISDRIGRRRVLLIGSGAMTVALLLHVLATGYVSFLLARALAGCAGGMLSGAAISFIGDYFRYERRGWAAGWVMSSIALGQILGVPLGTILAGELGIQAPFLMFAVTMALTFALVYRFVPQPNIERTREPLTLAHVLSEYAELLGRREPRMGAAVYFLMFLSMSLFVVYFPTWLAEERDATARQIAALFFAGGVANALIGPMAGRLSDRIGRKRLVIGACAGLALITAASSYVVNVVWAAFPLFFGAMVMVACRMSPLQALLTALAPDRRRGTLMSMTIAIGQVGYAAGGVLAGLLYTSSGFGATSIASAIATIAMGAVVWLYLPEPGRDHHEGAAAADV